MESVEAKTKDIMPVAFEFKCVPFEGLKERPFKLRLSIITGDRPVLVLRIIQLEAVQEDMANEFGNDSNLLIVFYVQIMPDDLVMQLHRF